MPPVIMMSNNESLTLLLVTIFVASNYFGYVTPQCSCTNAQGYSGCLTQDDVCPTNHCPPSECYFGPVPCIGPNGCPEPGTVQPPQQLNPNHTMTFVKFMDPIPIESYIYECQNSSLFLGVYNVSLSAFDYLERPFHLYVNTVTCLTVVPALPALGAFDVREYNSCDNAGGCAKCGPYIWGGIAPNPNYVITGCNCSCRVSDPWFWNCCADPCFGCSRCCNCNGQYNYDTWVGDAGAGTNGGCLQCSHDGWCGYPNGQMLTPTVCQFALVANAPAGLLDYESLQATNFSYQVRIKIRTIGCASCNAENYANLTIYVKDCDEYPIFENNNHRISIYQYDGIANEFKGGAQYILVRDPDDFNVSFRTFDLAVARVRLRKVDTGTGVVTTYGDVPPNAFYLLQTHFIGRSMNNSQLRYDVDRCGILKPQCLDYFRYMFTSPGGPNVYPFLEIYITAIDGGGLTATGTYTITILNTPDVPTWVNLNATISILEGTNGPKQIYPMEVIVPNWMASNTNTWRVVTVVPEVVPNSALIYIDYTTPCTPPSASILRCAGLRLTNNVGLTTLNYTTTPAYNVTVWFTNKVATYPEVYTITATLSINIIQRIYQPVLLPDHETVWVKENVTDAKCIYNITGAKSPNVGRTFFVYTMTLMTPVHNAFFLNGSAICYDSSRWQNGPVYGWTFNARLMAAPWSYKLEIAVTDPWSTMLANTFTLTVSILDVENPPILFTPKYVVIPETTTAYTLTPGVTATKETNQPALTFILADQSIANNNTMWQITAQSSTYASSAASATIIANPLLAKSPMFNNTLCPVIYLPVVCYSDYYTITQTVTIYVTRVNTPPYFINLPNMTWVAEQSTGFFNIFTVTTGDRENDYRQVFFCNTGITGLLTPSDATNKFTIDPDMMVIKTNLPSLSTFDYVAQPTYTLTVCVVDTPPFPLTSNISINYFVVQIARNQTAPYFTVPAPAGGVCQYTILPNLKETTTGQGYLFTMSAADRESDPPCFNITHRRPYDNTGIRLIKECSNILEYNSSSAPTLPIFNATRWPKYEIIIETSDFHSTPTSTCTFTINIDPVYKPAVWTSLPAYITVREDVYWSSDLVTVGAKDPNGGIFPVTISLLSLNPPSGSSKFYFNTSGNNEVGYNFNPQFAYGVVNSYIYRFTAWNTVDPTITGELVIDILPVSQGPFINITSATVPLHENVTASQTLWDMRAKDNSSLTLRYIIADMEPEAFDKFFITSSGVIKNADSPKFNYQTTSSYIVYAVSINPAGQRTTFTLTVSIINDPEPPVITNLPSVVNVKETTTGNLGGGLFYTTCVDQDGRALTWGHTVIPASGMANFNMSSNGVITTTAAAKFSYNAVPYYYVLAFCSNGFYTTTGTLTVVIGWSTTTTTTTPKPRTTRPDDLITTAVTTEGDVLTKEQIGAIVGSLLGALALAGISWGIAKALQRKAVNDGIVDNMKHVPQHQYKSWKM